MLDWILVVTCLDMQSEQKEWEQAFIWSMSDGCFLSAQISQKQVDDSPVSFVDFGSSSSAIDCSSVNDGGGAVEDWEAMTAEIRASWN